MKQCIGCNEVKPLDQFNWKIKKKGRRNALCRPCLSEKKKEHYVNNKEKHLQRSRKYKQALFEWFRQTYVYGRSCVDCGFNDWRVLDFDHVRGIKLGHPPAMARKGLSRKRIIAEIGKCEIRCRNCHTIRHLESRMVS